METDFEKLAFEVLKAEAQMTDEQRMQFWSVITMPYCYHCGKFLAYAELCYCSYDEL